MHDLKNEINQRMERDKGLTARRWQINRTNR